jgi:serine/threonine-protein kinase
LAPHEHDQTMSATAAATTDATPPPQMLAGRYRIEGLLGVGGMGAVYKVRDVELDEIVALKTLKRGFLEQPGALDRFRREVKLARKVTHANVARTFDIGEHPLPGGTTEKFLTMEYVDGLSLGRRLEERGALAPSEAVRIAIAIASALEAAHAAGVVHRDLKPDNVMLAREGTRVVVTDFGIARSHVDDASATVAGAAVGTPAYMAPEQVEGKVLDGRADLYALGLVLYEMVIGAPAFSGATPFALAAARLVAPAPDPLHTKPELMPALASLITKLLARRPEDRVASASDARAALESIASASSPSATPMPAPIVPEVARSLAIMPLRMEGPSDDAWIAEGSTSDLADALCMVRGLRVRARALPQGDEDARAFGQRMGVELVLAGAVRRMGETLRLTTRLTSVLDGYQIWAGRAEGTLGELLVMADRSAREIAMAIAGAELAPRKPIPSAPEMAEMALRARRYVWAILSDDAGIEQLEQLRKHAPDEPRLLASLAIAHARLGGFLGPGEARSRAQALAARALELGPDLAEPYVALAHVRYNEEDTAGAMRLLRVALAKGPSVADVHDLIGRILQEADELDDAMRFLDRALWLDPQLAFARVDRFRIHMFHGDIDRATRELEVLADTSPTHHATTYIRARVWAGRPIGPMMRAPLSPRIRVQLETVLRAIERGHFESDERVGLEQALLQTRPGTRAARLFTQLQCEVATLLGERESAVARLHDAVGHGLEDLAWLRRCPAIASLRGTPEHERALEIVSARSAVIVQAWREG